MVAASAVSGIPRSFRPGAAVWRGTARKAGGAERDIKAADRSTEPKVQPRVCPRVVHKEMKMGRGLLLWLIGIPLPIILLIWLFGGLS